MSDRLRVLIIRNAFQQDAGGAEQYALNLAIALRHAGHEPILVTKVLKIQEKAKKLGIKQVGGKWHDSQKWDRWYYLRYPFFTLWYMWIILSQRVNVVHPQSRDDFIFATSAARLLRRKVIWTDHADLKYVLDALNHYNPRIRKWIMRAAKSAYAITTPSNSEMESISAVAPDLPKLRVVHNGVFVPQNTRPVDKTNKLVIGTNARLRSAKGIDELIKGFAGLKRQDVDLWLVGGESGNKQKYQQLASKLGVINRVKFIGYVNNPNDYVAAMDIFVHASHHEAFSLAIIEAAMLGRPIIATSVGGTPEIIDEKCGVLIEPKSPEAIKQALDILLKDKAKRDKLGKAAQEKAKRDFDFQKIVEQQIIPLYEGVL